MKTQLVECKEALDVHEKRLDEQRDIMKSIVDKSVGRGVPRLEGVSM